jgi:hypothetical protein
MKHKTLLIIPIILTMVTLACGPCGTISELTSGGEEIIQTLQPSPESGGEQPPSPPSSGGEQPTSPPGSGSEQPTSPPESSGGAPEIAELSAVNSYRLTMTWRGESEDGSQSYEMIMTEAWVKEPPARHFTMSSAASGAEEGPGMSMEMIRIGDSSWMKMGDTWMQTNTPDDSVMGDDFTSAWEGILGEEDIENLIPAGEETVNGIHCKHYTTGGDTTVVAPGPEGGTVEMEVEGEVWVADQPGLPAIAIRWRSRMEGGFFPMPLAGGAPGESSVVYLEYDVTDVNMPIVIEPPEE